MSFKINYPQRMAKTLKNLSKDEAKEFLRRAEGHLQKHGNNRLSIAKMFFILDEIYDRKEKQRIENSAPLLDFKHKGIDRHRGEIVRLHEEGLSAEKIANELCRKKDAPSISTIKRYLKAVSDWREING